MKFLSILAVGCLAVTASIFGETYSSFQEGNRWYVPRNSNSFNWRDKEKAERYSKARDNIYDNSLAPVEFYLYTKLNPFKGKKVFARNDSILASNFNSAHPTRFIIHDYFNSYLTPTIKNIRNSWMNVGHYNVFVIDWPSARLRLYSDSALTVSTVGANVSIFIDYLVKSHGMLLQTTHVIGYGLGAHVAGYAGRNVKNGQLDTIIGLDPSSSSFDYNEPSKRLNSTDAYYVETIQTSGSTLGYKYPIGLATFYPNGGLSQPKCEDIMCNRQRSAIYYTESITFDSFASIRCTSYDDASAKNCGLIHSTVRMGGHKHNFMVSGIFYVPVNDRSPFGILL